MGKLQIIILCGVAGSGKSTESHKLYETLGFPVLSSDVNRSRLGRGENDQSVSRQAFDLMASETKNLLKLGQSVILDACFRTPKSRKAFIEIGRECGANITAYCIDTPIAIAKERNSKRTRFVPNDVIDRQYQTLIWPTLDEVDRIVFIRDGKEDYAKVRPFSLIGKNPPTLSNEQNRPIRKNRHGGYISFDIDRTLFERHSGDPIENLGVPIPNMIAKVKSYLSEGRKVVILTARSESQWGMIVDALAAQGIVGVQITNKKSSRMDLLFDDKAVGCIENVGVTHFEMLTEARNLIDALRSDTTNVVGVSFRIDDWMQNYNLVVKSYLKNERLK